MKKIQKQIEEDNVRTQITLPRDLKKRIEYQATIEGKSLAGYIREAAVQYLAVEEKGAAQRKQLAEEIVGSLDLRNYPEWSTLEKINDWVRDLRRDRE